MVSPTSTPNRFSSHVLCLSARQMYSSGFVPYTQMVTPLLSTQPSPTRWPSTSPSCVDHWSSASSASVLCRSCPTEHARRGGARPRREAPPCPGTRPAGSAPRPHLRRDPQEDPRVVRSGPQLPFVREGHREDGVHTRAHQLCRRRGAAVPSQH